jgi:hypothetical protein
MAVDDALHRCQSHSGAWEILDPVQALEGAEKLILVPHVKTCTIIPDIKYTLLIPLLLKDYVGIMFPAGKFPGISQQVVHHHPQ